MSTQLQLRKGTSADIAAATGAIGEVFYNTDKKTLVPQDGVTVGGFELARKDLSNLPAASIPTSLLADGASFAKTDLSNVASGAIATAKLADHSVTLVKMDSGGNVGQVLTGNGVGASPIWQVPSVADMNGLTVILSGGTIIISTAGLLQTFRSPTLTDGTVTSVNVGALTLTIPTAATLGMTQGVSSRLMVYQILNSDNSVQLGVANMQANISESKLYNATGISASSTSATTLYATSAATSRPVRLIGHFDISQATAGTWGTGPTAVQTASGRSLSAIASLGFAQTWQNVSGSRTFGTTYYNTTGRPIAVYSSAILATQGGMLTGWVNGVQFFLGSVAISNGAYSVMFFIVPPNSSYTVSVTGSTITSGNWMELS